MSRNKRRRPGGHPAKVAARRERGTAGRPRGEGQAVLNRAAQQICRDAATLKAPFEAELWASELLGSFWEQRHSLPAERLGRYDLALGGPLIDAVARVSGSGARVALSVIERVEDGELGARAGELARTLAGDRPLPAWIAGVGDAEIQDAAVMREDVFDDGFTVFIEACHPDGERHATGVHVDNNLGVMAKDILLADSIDRVEQIIAENPDPHREVRLEPLEPGIAAGQIHAAIELTDMTLGPSLGDDYARLRAVALLRADETPGLQVAPGPPEVPAEEREQLLDEFLSSPEGDTFQPDSDETYAASLAIDFCCDYVDGRPLRWSPVVVELFMADWIPRKVMTDAGLLERLPAALDAWVRFAGRKRDAPGWAIEKTCEAIPHWEQEMVRGANDPAAGGPAKQLLAAAGDAGIDLTDENAVKTFIAGWNARSEPA
jgi:hypothetical protein